MTRYRRKEIRSACSTLPTSKNIKPIRNQFIPRTSNTRAKTEHTAAFSLGTKKRNGNKGYTACNCNVQTHRKVLQHDKDQQSLKHFLRFPYYPKCYTDGIASRRFNTFQNNVSCTVERSNRHYLQHYSSVTANSRDGRPLAPVPVVTSTDILARTVIYIQIYKFSKSLVNFILFIPCTVDNQFTTLNQHHVNCVKKWLTSFYEVLLWFGSLMLVPCGSKYVGILGVIL